MQNIKIALRRLLKEKFFATVNVVGLSLAIAVSVVVILFALHHYSFDKNVYHINRSYRINSGVQGGTEFALSFPAFSEALKEHPMVENYTVFYRNKESFNVVMEEESYPIENPLYADADFMDYFHIKLSRGLIEDINKPNAIFISEQISSSLFKGDNPVGKVVTLSSDLTNDNNDRTATIVGVIASDNKMSHLKYGLIHSKKGFYEKKIQSFARAKIFGAYSYVTLFPNVSVTEFEVQVCDMLLPFLPMPTDRRLSVPTLDGFFYRLQALKDIHFTSSVSRDLSMGISRKHLNTLLVSGLLILLIVILNFLIMNSVRENGRKRQAIIIKSLGGSRLSNQMIAIVEILILVLFATSLAFLFIKLLNPLIHSQLWQGWSVDMGQRTFYLVFLAVMLLPIIIGTLGSRYQFHSNTTNKQKSTKRSVIPFIVFQFAVVIALISYSVLLYKQVDFIHSKDLGFEAENVMIIKVPSKSPNVRVIKEEVSKLAGVVNVGTSKQYPGYMTYDRMFESAKGIYPLGSYWTNEDAIEVLGIDVVEEFSHGGSQMNYINETFYKALLREYSREEIINGDFNPTIDWKTVRTPPLTFKVHGVVNDFHYASLYKPIGNFIFFIKKPQDSNYRFLLVRYQQGDLLQVKEEINALVESIYNVSRVDYKFLDEELNDKYKAEELLLSLTSFFALITILIAAMGLFAFMLFTTQRRTKEIGIRKVNGATTSEILLLLNADFIKWVTIAFVIACPIAYYAMIKWLENFAYKTELSWWIFALAGMLALAIALFTVSFQSMKAARRNPIESLRYE